MQEDFRSPPRRGHSYDQRPGVTFRSRTTTTIRDTWFGLPSVLPGGEGSGEHKRHSAFVLAWEDEIEEEIRWIQEFARSVPPFPTALDYNSLHMLSTRLQEIMTLLSERNVFESPVFHDTGVPAPPRRGTMALTGTSENAIGTLLRRCVETPPPSAFRLNLPPSIAFIGYVRFTEALRMIGERVIDQLEEVYLKDEEDDGLGNHTNDGVDATNQTRQEEEPAAEDEEGFVNFGVKQGLMGMEKLLCLLLHCIMTILGDLASQQLDTSPMDFDELCIHFFVPSDVDQTAGRHGALLSRIAQVEGRTIGTDEYGRSVSGLASQPFLAAFLNCVKALCEHHQKISQRALNPLGIMDRLCDTVRTVLINAEQYIANNKIEIIHRCLRTVTETLQGPCYANQVKTLVYGLHLEAFRLLEQLPESVLEEEREIDGNEESLEESILTFLVSLLELYEKGRPEEEDCILQFILHFKKQVLLRRIEHYYKILEREMADNVKALDAEASSQVLALLYQLADSMDIFHPTGHPSLRGMERWSMFWVRNTSLNERWASLRMRAVLKVARVEIDRNGVLEVLYFPVPPELIYFFSLDPNLCRQILFQKLELGSQRRHLTLIMGVGMTILACSRWVAKRQAWLDKWRIGWMGSWFSTTSSYAISCVLFGLSLVANSIMAVFLMLGNNNKNHPPLGIERFNEDDCYYCMSEEELQAPLSFTWEFHWAHPWGDYIFTSAGWIHLGVALIMLAIETSNYLPMNVMNSLSTEAIPLGSDEIIQKRASRNVTEVSPKARLIVAEGSPKTRGKDFHKSRSTLGYARSMSTLTHQSAAKRSFTGPLPDGGPSFHYWLHRWVRHFDSITEGRDKLAFTVFFLSSLFYNWNSWYRLCYAIFCLFGLILHPIFVSITLVEFIIVSGLDGTLKKIKGKLGVIARLFALSVVLAFVFSAAGYVLFNRAMSIWPGSWQGTYYGNSLLNVFLYTANMGFRANGGIADVIRPIWYDAGRQSLFDRNEDELQNIERDALFYFRSVSHSPNTATERETAIRVAVCVCLDVNGPKQPPPVVF